MTLQPDMAVPALAPEAAHDDRRPPIKAPEADGVGVQSTQNGSTQVALEKKPAVAQEVAYTGAFAGLRQKIQNFRTHTLKALPAFIVNNDVSIISGLHLASELLMLKSGGMQFLKNNRGGEKVNYLIDPLNNLVRGLRGIDKEVAGGKAIQNAWALRSTSVGFMGWLVGTFVPNKKDSEQAILDDAQLYDQSKVGYLTKRFTEALQPWKSENKRQFVGLAVTVAGALSALSGLTNIGGDGKYYLNLPRMIGGIITTLAGSSLLCSLTDRDGWARYGQAIWLRLPVIGLSINKMFKKTVQFKGAADVEAFNKASKEWKYYAAGAAGFQAASTVSYFFGGVHKEPDGTIIDTKQDKALAKEELKEKKQLAEERGVRVQDIPNDDVLRNTPKSTVTRVSGREVAMPEQRELAAQAAGQTA